MTTQRKTRAIHVNNNDINLRSFNTSHHRTSNAFAVVSMSASLIRHRQNVHIETKYFLTTSIQLLMYL